jgi:hypothetical protein
MKRIILIALCVMCIAGTASAYQLYLDCPDSVLSGLPLKCSIDSNFPAGTTFNIVFYQTQYTATEVSRQPITIQENQLTQYKLLDTKGLPGGNYKVEVQYVGADEARLSSDSVTLQLLKVIDRSGDITITSPISQKTEDALRIEGSIYKLGAGGVKLEVRGPDGVVFDNWIGSTDTIQTGAGVFTKQVIVTRPGDYDVLFTDAKGYIGTVTFHVTAPSTQVITAIPTTVATVRTTSIPTSAPTPWPTATQSPLSPVTVLIGIAGAGLAVFAMKKN